MSMVGLFYVEIVISVFIMICIEEKNELEREREKRRNYMHEQINRRLLKRNIFLRNIYA